MTPIWHREKISKKIVKIKLLDLFTVFFQSISLLQGHLFWDEKEILWKFNFSRKLTLKRSRVLIKLKFAVIGALCFQVIKEIWFHSSPSIISLQIFVTFESEFLADKQKDKSICLFLKKWSVENPLQNRTHDRKSRHWPGQSVKFFFLSFFWGMKLMPCGDLYE